MALFLSSNPSLLFRNPKLLRRFALQSPNLSISSYNISAGPRLLSFRVNSSAPGEEREPDSSYRSIPIGTGSNSEESDEKSSGKIADEWGEEAEPEEASASTKLTDADPPVDEDEWGRGDDGGFRDSGFVSGNGSALAVDDKLGDLKRCLVDSLYGTELGFRASPEVRAEVLELVNQLESLNPTPAPTQEASLDGNWVLMYTAFSELLPLLAAGSIPTLKVKRICQAVDMGNLTIENSTTISSPLADFSFSATATFEVRSPSRIQVQFKEGILKPPEVHSSLTLPPDIDIFGQKIDLLPVQQSLSPLQEVVANISRGLSGQPPLKVPVPGNQPGSWLIITYLDEDLRISRGDGGLFILAKEGSSLLDQLF